MEESIVKNKKEKTPRYSYTVNEFYQGYKHKINYNKNSIYWLEKKEFTDICKDFNKLIAKKIMEDGYIFHMPFNMGSLTILRQKTPMNRSALKLDYKKTKEYKKPIYHLNTHSRDFYYYWHWEKPIKGNINMKRAYHFVATRFNKRRLAKLIIDGNTNYLG